MSAVCTLEAHTASDGYRWQYQHYPAAGVPRARLVCIHGIQSHSGWYTYSCARLAEAGYGVSFLDRRGAGLNREARGDTPGFRRLLDDIAEFLKAPRPGEESLPTFLIAISWGGKLAVALQKRHPGLVDGLALIAPGFCPRVGPPAWQRLAIVGAWMVAPRRLFPIPLSDAELFTATPRWQEFIRTDPLSLRRASARFLIESVRLDGYLRWARKRVTVPVLVLLAEHDRIIDNARTRRFVADFPAADKEVFEYPGAHHTLEFEPEPDHFLGDLLRWLDRHVTAGKVRRSSPI
jgi:alpha-beta hydrolase superfamily lysophospholipase